MCIKWLLPSQAFQLKISFITIEYVTIAMYKGDLGVAEQLMCGFIQKLNAYCNKIAINNRLELVTYGVFVYFSSPTN